MIVLDLRIVARHGVSLFPSHSNCGEPVACCEFISVQCPRFFHVFSTWPWSGPFYLQATDASVKYICTYHHPLIKLTSRFNPGQLSASGPQIVNVGTSGLIIILPWLLASKYRKIMRTSIRPGFHSARW